MSKKVKVTEKLRKEIRYRIAALTPDCTWYILARDERESVELAFLRVDKDDKAEVFSDDTVTAMIYTTSRGRQLVAERDIEWLNDNDLWVGAKFTVREEEEEEEDFGPPNPLTGRA